MVGLALGIDEVIAGVVAPFLNLAGGIGKMLPKKCKVLPNGPTEGSEVDYANQISVALQKELGRSHRATKTVMRWTGASERTVKNWITGERGPSGDYLVALIRNSDEVMQCILHMSDRPQAVAIAKIPDIVRLMCEVLELFGRQDLTIRQDQAQRPIVFNNRWRRIELGVTQPEGWIRDAKFRCEQALEILMHKIWRR
ncbi:hypothetical protein JOS77_13370 [Chromobacterium haemolyticum]|nr:hypothetical protein JOS77_13370 [Chromobacterium haemolyticum]